MRSSKPAKQPLGNDAELRRLEALIEQSTDGFTIFDSQIRIVYESPANVRIHGYQPEELRGRTLFEFIHPHDAERLVSRFEPLIGIPGAVDSDTVRFRHRDGRWIFLSGSVRNCLHDPRLNGLLNTFRDVTDLASAQEELHQALSTAEEAAARQRRLLNQASHEFRTPLTLIREPLSMLRESHLAPTQQDQLDLALRSVQQLENLVLELTHLARLESRTIQLNCAERDIVSFVKTQIALFRPMAEAKRVNLIWEGPVAFQLSFDSFQLQKVVNNLLANALRHTPEQGKIRVTVIPPEVNERLPEEKRRLCIVVSDTGEGMDEDVKKRAFEQFFQGPRFGKAPHEGMGIGLPLVRDIVELHGGSVQLETAPGKGSTFTLQLPLRQPIKTGSYAQDIPEASVDLREEAPESSNTRTSTSSGPILLIAEDNADLRRWLQSQLQGEFRIFLVEDGRDALKFLKEQPVDIVLSDVMMPHVHGIDLCAAMKADAQLRNIPIILLSAKASAEDRTAGIHAGAIDYIAKPFSTKELRARLHTALQRPVRAAPASADDQFLQQLNGLVEKNLSDPSFTVTKLARKVGLSSRQLQRRLLLLTGETPVSYLKRMRLEQAHRFLLAKAFQTQSELANAVGMSPGYFRRSYRAFYSE